MRGETAAFSPLYLERHLQWYGLAELVRLTRVRSRLLALGALVSLNCTMLGASQGVGGYWTCRPSRPMLF